MQFLPFASTLVQHRLYGVHVTDLFLFLCCVFVFLKSSFCVLYPIFFRFLYRWFRKYTVIWCIFVQNETHFDTGWYIILYFCFMVLYHIKYLKTKKKKKNKKNNNDIQIVQYLQMNVTIQLSFVVFISHVKGVFDWCINFLK